MRLAFHQLRHEFRRARLFVAVFWIILLGNYGVAAGWLGQPELHSGHHGWISESMVPMLLTGSFWIALTLLVTAVVTADAPANRERFLATRPLPARAILVAKALFILLALLVPATTVEVLSLRTIGTPGAFVIMGVAQYGGLLAVYCITTALFAGHWKSTFTALLALGLIIGLASAFLGTVVSLLDFLTREHPGGRYRFPEPNALTTVVATLATGLGFAATLRLQTLRQWKTRHLIPPFAGLTMAWFALAIYLPLRPATLPGSNEALVQKTLGSSADAVTFTPAGIDYTRGGPRNMATYRVQPETARHPQDWEIRWQSRDTSWITNGRVIHRRTRYGRHQSMVEAGDRAPGSSALLSALRRHAPGMRLIIPRNTTYQSDLRLGYLSYSQDATPREPMSVTAELTASAVRWELAAALHPFADEQSRGGHWKLLGFHHRPEELKAFLSMSTHRLFTIDDPSKLTDNHGWSSNVVFALHLPTCDMVWMGDPTYSRCTPTLSSAIRTFGEVRFENHHNRVEVTPHDLRSARLLVFEARNLGQVSRGFRSPEFTLQPRPEVRGAVLAAADRPREPRITPAVLARWLREHADLPADLPADEFRAHLDAFFDLECRANAHVDYPHSPAVNHLARFIPRHRSVFLESIRGMASDSTASRLILRALSQAAGEDDREAIIAELPRTPILIRTISDRGWGAEARPRLIEMLKSRFFDRELLQVCVSLDDPALDPLLLRAFEHQATTSSYRILRAVPRLHRSLDQIASRQWSPGLLLMNNLIDSNLELALAQGRPDALAHLYDILPHLNDNSYHTWQAARLVTDTMLLPADLRPHRNDEKKVLAWLRTRQPADFRFDPVLRRFVLVDSNPS